ncbi:serine/threonine protein kinase [Planctomyces sp. SH-PL14]|uniref:serine/threonine protein kinase n=1 Tax=Planctomyces sp. SH-PL14 TaxID=1632864 RepID=UPI00078C7649|nr:serine/threonine-protein kinase [Planctomyces sp. SH-PL14]AMV18948.1 Serine/threonine-protein kinase StkP [Planctomyces sp. SH-PL14]
MSSRVSSLGATLVERGFLAQPVLEAALQKASAQEVSPFLQGLVREGHLTHFQEKAIERQQIDSLCFGPYLILDILGRGGMSVIFRARHRHMDRLVALKVISPDIEKDPIAIQRFWREVRIIAQLDHPNIVKAFDAGDEGGKMYLAMELVRGVNCSQLIKDRGPLKPQVALKILGQAALGLDYAHTSGIVHRDVKPSNILISDKGMVKVLDLGLALLSAPTSSAVQNTDLTRTGIVMGTVDYIAPEQARGRRDLDGRADIYSLGCTLFYLITGTRPYSGANPIEIILQHTTAPVPKFEAAGVTVPPPVQELLDRMMVKDPEQRLGSMSEVVAAITALRGKLDRKEAGVVVTAGKRSAPDPQLEELATQVEVTQVQRKRKEPSRSSESGPPVSGNADLGVDSGAAEEVDEGPRPKSDSLPTFMEVPTRKKKRAVVAAPSRWPSPAVLYSSAAALTAVAILSFVISSVLRSPGPGAARPQAAASETPAAPTTGQVRLDLQGDLQGVELLVDSAPHAVQRSVSLALPPGRHEVVVRRGGKEVRQHSLNIQAGQTLSILLDVSDGQRSVEQIKIR